MSWLTARLGWDKKKPGTLTSSQKHSMVAGTIALAAIVAEHAPQIETAFPTIHWLAPVLSVLGLGTTMLARSLRTDRSGTGTGVINSGPDDTAQTAQIVGEQVAEAGAAALAQNAPPKALTDVSTVLQVLSAIYPNAAPLPDVSKMLTAATDQAKQQLTDHTNMLKAAIANTPVNVNMSQQFKAQDLADGHVAIDQARKAAPLTGGDPHADIAI